MRTQLSNRRRQGGFVAIELLFGLIIFSLMTVIATNLMSKRLDSQSYQIAADQQQAVADAATKYLKDNFATVLASATATNPAQITVAMLRNTNYLPSGFSDTNAFGQTLVVLARKPAANQLETIVLTTGGEQIDEIGTREIAENLGGTGGFIPVSDTSIVQGIRGGWQIALSNFAVNPGDGHTASALFLQDGAVANDYLYRNAIPGKPELNRMNTALNMGANDINNAASITASGTVTAGGDVNAAGNVNATSVNASANVTAATARISGETYTGNWFRTQGDSGWYSEKWGGGWYMSDSTWVRAYGDKNVYSGGEIRGGKLTSGGRTQVGEYLQINGVASLWGSCSPNNLVALDATGRPLSCQGGFWLNVGTRRVMTLNPAGGGITSFVTGQDYSMDLGWHTECVLSRFGDAQGEPVRMTLGQVTPIAGPDLLGRYQWLIYLNAPVGSSVAATCYTDM